MAGDVDALVQRTLRPGLASAGPRNAAIAPGLLARPPFLPLLPENYGKIRRPKADVCDRLEWVESGPIAMAKAYKGRSQPERSSRLACRRSGHARRFIQQPVPHLDERGLDVTRLRPHEMKGVARQLGTEGLA